MLLVAMMRGVSFEEELVRNLAQMSNVECSTESECVNKANENYVGNQFFASIPYFAMALEKQTVNASSCAIHNNLGVSFLQQRYVDEGVRHLRIAQHGDNGTNVLCVSAAKNNLDRLDHNIQDSTWLTVGVQPATELARRKTIADELFFEGRDVSTALIHYKSILQEQYDPITHVKSLWMRQRVADWEGMGDSLRALGQQVDQLIQEADRAGFSSSASETLAELCGYLSATLPVPVALAHEACKHRSATLERDAKAAGRSRSNTDSAVQAPQAPPRSGVLRLGYVSQSFCNHPVGQQMVQLMPFHRAACQHDQERGCPLANVTRVNVTRVNVTRVNVTCYSLVNCNPATDKWTALMMKGCHQYVELGDYFGTGADPSSSAARAASRIAQDAIEVLVDINGYKTSAAAMAVLAQLKAQTCSENQVALGGARWSGSGCVVTAHMLETTNLYASGMGFGAHFIDFFITDSVLSPADMEQPGRPGWKLSSRSGGGRGRYEGVMVLPHLFWAPQTSPTDSNSTNDTRHGSTASNSGASGNDSSNDSSTDSSLDTRAAILRQYGLPPDAAFVIGSFNRIEKVSRAAFHAWCRVLIRLPGSVLWLFAGGEEVQSALKAEAAALGVHPSRLVFAGFVGAVEHRQRLQALVDISLDTPGYNGGTTTADLLRAAVPVLTLTSSLAGATSSGSQDDSSDAAGAAGWRWRGRGAQGRPYYSRMASSVLTSAGLELLVCHSLKEYVDQAVAAGAQPERWRRLAGTMAARLQAGDSTKQTVPLFDHEEQVSSMLRGFQSAVEHAHAGGGGHIVVPKREV
jgi:predicted O-linked N-acetylglucosamine transferase (SPINDLY family)